MARRLNFIGSLVDIIGGASRSTTPASLGSNRKSPTAERGVQAGNSSKRSAGDDKKTVVKPIQPPGQRNQAKKSQSEERRNSRGAGGQDDQYRNRQVINRNNQQQLGNQQQYQRGGWGNRGGLRQRGRPRGTGYRPNQGQPNINPAAKAKNTLKFENDYDFEQANTQFEELRNQLSKV